MRPVVDKTSKHFNNETEHTAQKLVSMWCAKYSAF